MNSATSAARTTILLTIAFMFAMPFCPVLLAVVDDHNPIGVTGVFEGVTTTGGAYNVLNHNATRQIDDIVVPGAIGKYGLKMTRYYNSRKQDYFNQMGPGWTHEYMWANYGDKIYYPYGNVWDSHCTGDYGLGGPLAVSDWLESFSGLPNFRLADGGSVLFAGVVINGTTYYSLPTQIIDPYGQITTLTYNPNGTFAGFLDKVTEPGGRYLQFLYTQQSGTYPQITLTRVEAHGLGDSTVTDWVNYTYALQSTGGTNVQQGWCLTTVTYSDSQTASYTYTIDNQPIHPTGQCPCTDKILPLVKTCKDVRYKGPMRQICYDYQDLGPHGAITAERYSLNGSINGVQVSKISPPAPSPTSVGVTFSPTYTETRADGPTRTFNYTALSITRPPPEEECPGFNGPAPQQFLQSYSDFNGHTTYLYYDDPTTWYVTSVKDANLHTTFYQRGPPPNAYPGPKGIGQILKITHPDQTHIDYTYYDEGSDISGHYLQQITDERGNITYHTRDGYHRIIRTDHKDSAGNIIAYEEFTYDNTHNYNFGLLTTYHLPSDTTSSGSYVHFKYDTRGLLIAKTNPTTFADWATAFSQAPQTTYTYYSSSDGGLYYGWIDRVKTMTLPANVSGLHATETYEYDKNVSSLPVAGRGLVTKITYADGKYKSFGYDAYGNKLWEKNELLKQTTHIYDDYNRLTSTTDPLLNPEAFNYLKPGTSTSYAHTTNSVYTHTDRAGIATTCTYDENFRKTTSTVAGQSTWFHYDPVGNQDWVADPRGTSGRTWPNADPAYTTYTTYDMRNRKSQLSEPLGHTTHYYYEDGINLTRILRPDNTTETKVYDAMNRVSSDTVPQTAQVSLSTLFGYWPSGKLFSEQDPKGQIRYFYYNETDQLTSMSYADTIAVQSWSYDDAHNLKSRTTVNGNANPGSGEIQRFTYDNRNRKLSMYWDNNAEWATYGYDFASRLTEAKNGTGSLGQNVISDVVRQYDDDDRLILDQQNVTGLGIKNVNYPAYDDDGKLLQKNATNQDGSAIGYDYTFSYDTTGRFQTIKPTGGAITFQYYYDTASNETERHNLSNGVNEIYPRDALNRMQSLDVIKTSTLGKETYGYDMMNRLASVTYTTGPTDSFQYYQDGELNTATLGNLGHALTYNLDTAGNRITVVDNTATTTYTRNVLNQYTDVTGSSITNGPEHEISDYQGSHYTYINDERLVAVSAGGSTYQLAYDALGRCVKRTTNAGTFPAGQTVTYYIYDGEKPILEYRSTDLTHPVKNVYGKGVDEILMRTDLSVNGGAAFYYQQNHEGSVTMLTNSSGTAIERYRYDVYGAPTIYDGSWNSRSATLYNNRFLFTGREYNASFGFYEYRARAYSPTLGRFMSEDPKGFDAGDYNLFRYCHNDPEDLTDPMGLASDTHNFAGLAPREVSRILAEIKALQNLAHALGWPGHGAIGIGMANFHIGQLQQALGQMVFRAEVQRAIAGGGRFAQLGNPVQPHAILRSGDLRIDTDGSGPDHGDPTHANETAYQPAGRSLNADTDPYVAIPTSLLRQGVRLGDRAVLTVNGRSAPGVVGDTGATPGLVEASFRLVHDVGIRTQDVRGVGPVPAAPGEVPATMTLYPSGN